MSGRRVRPRRPGERFCIVLLTGLGDVVHGLPLVHALKAQDPTRRITWVAEPMPAGILAGVDAVDEVVVYRKKDGLKGVWNLGRDLAGWRFDVTLNLNVYTKSAWPTLLSRAPYRLGFDPGRSFEATWLAANDHLRPGPRRHTADLFLEFLDHLGVPHPRLEWGLRPVGAEVERQAAFFGALDERPKVALVPASAQARKDWVTERWAEVADAVEHDFGFQCVLVGGPGERETAIAREIVARTRSNPVWALGDGVRRLVWLLDGCALAIAPDTGPLHISRALGTPVIGLYGHTNPWRVGPHRAYEDLWVDRYTEPGAAPDPSLWPPKKGRMQQITVNDVLDRVERAVRAYGVGEKRNRFAQG